MNQSVTSETSEEKKRLADIATHFSMGTGFNGRLEKYSIQTVREQCKGQRLLDVGCADGFMVRALAPYFTHITAIDGSEELIARAKELHLSNVEFLWTLFEEYKPTQKFDTVILSDILEHVDNAVELLRLAKEWICEDGVVVALCPNAYSIHRQIGVLSGMLTDVHDLNPTDISVGHRRVYDIQTLTTDIETAGLHVRTWGGMYLKPLSNGQMDALPDSVVDAFYAIGKNLPPDLLTELYVQSGQ